MRGHVSGTQMPQHGKTVAIQARAKGVPAWTTVTVLRSDTARTFRFSYRFRRTFSRTTYEFRAVALRQRGYPYFQGWSHIRHVTVSP
jgi:hypothetical protein